ncbi:hypothetical protein V8J85_06835 [Yoonia sp. 2307UL14-13]|uniref:hypothetical protein n=1 Tax=Yoonia sp. 2307UL14-13 TaxID=3126506 RepID=UPI00309F75AD
MQHIGRRKTQHWAQNYKDRVARLREEQRIQVAGEATVATSMTRGLCDFMNDVDASIVPNDLQAASTSADTVAQLLGQFSPQHVKSDQARQNNGHPRRADQENR